MSQHRPICYANLSFCPLQVETAIPLRLRSCHTDAYTFLIIRSRASLECLQLHCIPKCTSFFKGLHRSGGLLNGLGVEMYATGDIRARFLGMQS